jgi:phosphatidylserine/phosphatidylglycerophosphate/cardiolipin synthase-like enzyme
MTTFHYSVPFSLTAVDTQNIAAALHTLDIAAYTLVDNILISVILARAAAGVIVRLYLDRTELESVARGDPALAHSPFHALLCVPGITIKVKQSLVLMHMKAYCVDGVLLRDGSANFSYQGEELQDNSVIVTDDPAAIALFAAKFEAMWARPDNLSVAQAVMTSAAFARTPSYRGGVVLPTNSTTDTLT